MLILGMNIETLATFFGWCTVINFGLLLLAVVVWIVIKDAISKFAATLFGVTNEEMKASFLRVLLQYRAAIVILNLVPYIALKVMA